jgi:DNA-binding CsgD family transcriptional regulator
VGSLFGRDAERRRARTVLDSSARSRVVRALRIVGASGAGKTTLAETVAADAAGEGWLVATTPSFRIHTSLPLFAARRIAQSLLEALGENADRYSSGLALDRDRPEDFQEAFVRIVEGVTLDHRLLLVLDDAQWIDAQSRELLAQTATTLADRAIVLLTTERSDEGSQPALALEDESIALADLSASAAIEIVRSIYPAVSDEVAATIAASTRGHAMDLVAVATAARDSGAESTRDVSDSTRRVVVRDLALLDPEVRTFLQLAALIDEPIDFALLTQLWPRDVLLAMISQISGRYLVEDNNGLRFVHASVRESVLETIPIEIPLRFRIIDALKKLPVPRLEDYERLVAQSAACGDRELERETLLKLADIAATKSLYTLATSATERAMRIAPATREELIPICTRMSQMYNGMARALDAIRISHEALTQARAYGIVDGLGGVVASMILGYYHNGQSSAAHEVLTQHLSLLRSDSDQAQLLSLGEYLAMNDFDVVRSREFSAAFERVASSGQPIVMVRHHISKAFLALRMGDEMAALEAVRDAERAAEPLPVYISTMPRAVRMMHAFRFAGARSLEALLESRDDELNAALMSVLRAAIMLGKGAFDDARDFIRDKYHRSAGEERRAFAGLHATAAALQGLRADDQAWLFVRPEITAFTEGERSPLLLSVMSAWAVAESARSADQVRSLLSELTDLAALPYDFRTHACPVTLVLAAQNVRHNEVLERIAGGTTLWSDEQPANRAHVLLARGAASAILRRPGAADLLRQAQDIFVTLGADYFASLAEKMVSGGSAALRTKSAERPGNTTRREREIAAHVADGLTNREIAERLVLSERTVEGHIANLFAKLNVNSRTQLATWYLRTVSSVA